MGICSGLAPRKFTFGLGCFLWRHCFLFTAMNFSSDERLQLLKVLYHVESSNTNPPKPATPPSSSPPSFPPPSPKPTPPAKKPSKGGKGWSKRQREGVDSLREALLKLGTPGISPGSSGITVVNAAATLLHRLAAKHPPSSPPQRQIQQNRFSPKQPSVHGQWLSD